MTKKSLRTTGVDANIVICVNGRFIPLYSPEGMTSLGGSDGGRLDHQELFQNREALAGSGSPLA